MAGTGELKPILQIVHLTKHPFAIYGSPQPFGRIEMTRYDLVQSFLGKDVRRNCHNYFSVSVDLMAFGFGPPLRQGAHRLAPEHAHFLFVLYSCFGIIDFVKVAFTAYV